MKNRENKKGGLCMKKRILSILLGTTMVLGLVGCGSESAAKKESSSEPKKDESATVESKQDFDGEEISLLWVSNSTMDGINAVVAAAEKELNIKINIEQVPGGEDGDNVVKTRLASGDMADLLSYNCGALLSTLNPGEYFTDLTQRYGDKLTDDFIGAAGVDNVLYGIPATATQAGAVLYNKEMYEKYKLEVPKTWNEFLKNCEILKEKGETAVLGTDGDSWTSQVTYLGDEYNVETVVPDFPAKFEEGGAKYATTEAALKSFEKIEQLIPYMNEDHMATTYDDGCDIMMDGDAAHWIILTSALSNMKELYSVEEVNKLGCFGVPGDDAQKAGLTLWMPNAIYENKNTEHADAVKAFMDFYISDAGLNALAAAEPPCGPYAVKGYELPDDVYSAVKDMTTFIEAGNSGTALEFKTAVKGANCASICQELASGQTNAKEAAAKYDEDCKKQAMQLGLDW